MAIHEYTQDPEDFTNRYASFQKERAGMHFSSHMPVFLPGFDYEGQPVLITEFGGTVLAEGSSADSTFGYGTAADARQMEAQIKGLVDTILAQDDIRGYCYTQLTDTGREKNGLLTEERLPKVDPARLARIFINP